MPRRDGVNYDRQLITHSRPDGLPAKLPLVHMTAAWSATEIVRSGKFVTRRCDVFGAELLYFFVLRPAYRSRFGNEESHQISRFPVAFIVRPEAVPSPRHVYPFDTGGAAKGAFSSKADKYVPLEDYALEASHLAATGHIGWAFGALEAYFAGRLREDINDDIPVFESVTSGFVDVARMGVELSNEHDKRASTIELAAAHNVDLVGNVRLVILPKQYLEGNNPLTDLIEKTGAQVELYDWQPNRAPDEFQKDIRRICREWYGAEGIM
ncbi:hypothetical protein V5F59_11315 [Xanthobacter autotrophicus DSM 431]|uniref:hypothetical protein n=1 Tax=Xanthobacter nonsaccharivorans TaxID=3119912 RepID=UPI0037263207